MMAGRRDRGIVPLAWAGTAAALVVAAGGVWIAATDGGGLSPAMALVIGCGIVAILAMAVVQAALFRTVQTTRARLAEAIAHAHDGETRTRAIQEAASNAIVAIDTHCRVVEWNGAAERLFGYTAPEVAGRDGVDLLVPPDRRAFVRAIIDRFVTDGRYTHIGRRIGLTVLSARGDPIPAEVGLTHYRTANGLVLALHLRDLRGERDAVAALRATERGHRTVVDALREIIFQTDRDGVLTYLNLAWRRATRFSLEESLGRKLFEFVAPDDRPRIERLVASLAAQADTGLAADPVEVRFRTAESGTRVMLVIAQPLHDAGGAVTGVVGTVEDVTERRAAEMRLRDQLRFNRGLLEAVPVPLSVRGADGALIAVNRAWETFAGLAREAVLGRPMRELFPGVVADDLEATDRDLLASGGSTTEERLLRAAGGAHRTVLYCRSALVHEDGSAAGLISAFVDITEQKNAEAAARDARDAAEHANRAKVRFLKALSHEVRNPLAGILGMTGLALETRLDEEQREYLAGVQSSAESLLHIIDDVLDLPRIESGDLVIERKPCDVRAVAGAALRTVALAAREKRIELLLAIDPDVPAVIEGDVNRLRQVLLNLLGNALQFTAAGEIEIAVRPEGEGRLAFALRDTGCGMDTATRERVLAEIAAAHAGESGLTGVPLGVAIVARLLELMGGSTIAIESAPGAGTTFRFTLPAVPVVEDGGIATATAATAAIDAFVGRTVLVVMRHPGARALLARLLDERGLHATAAAGAEAEALARVRRFDVAFIDASLDTGAAGDDATDGYALAARLRALAPRLVSCILLEPGVGVNDAVKLRRGGIAGYLRKPVLESDLDRLLATMAADATAAFRESDESAAPPTAGATAHRRARVLVVEDHPVNQARVRRRLQNMGHEVTIAADGAAAIAATAERGFDLVLMDLEMPGVDGITATRAIRLREAGTGTRVPIIALTGHAYDQDRAAAFEAGMDGYLAKPVSPAALARVLQDHFGASDDSIATRGLTENDNDHAAVQSGGVR